MAKFVEKVRLRDMDFTWFCRNTVGLNWLAQILDARIGVKYHPNDPEFTFWWYIRKNFMNRHPWFYKTRWWLNRRSGP